MGLEIGCEPDFAPKLVIGDSISVEFSLGQVYKTWRREKVRHSFRHNLLFVLLVHRWRQERQLIAYPSPRTKLVS